jgi:hypothetical protein
MHGCKELGRVSHKVIGCISTNYDSRAQPAQSPYSEETKSVVLDQSVFWGAASSKLQHEAFNSYTTT